MVSGKAKKKSNCLLQGSQNSRHRMTGGLVAPDFHWIFLGSDIIGIVNLKKHLHLELEKNENKSKFLQTT